MNEHHTGTHTVHTHKTWKECLITCFVHTSSNSPHICWNQCMDQICSFALPARSRKTKKQKNFFRCISELIKKYSPLYVLAPSSALNIRYGRIDASGHPTHCLTLEQQPLGVWLQNTMPPTPTHTHYLPLASDSLPGCQSLKHTQCILAWGDRLLCSSGG